MEEEAEKNCESLLNLAMQADPRNPEVLQSMASVRMSQQRSDEARTCVEQAWDLWKDLSTGWLADHQYCCGSLIVMCR
jgi:thioredoxin-like negative regulator of GroEL